MKYFYGVLAVVCFVVGILAASWTIAATVMLWIGSGILLALAINEDTKQFENKQSDRLDRQLDIPAPGSPRRTGRVRRVLSGSSRPGTPVYTYYDDDGVDITDLIIAGIIIYDLMYEELEDGSYYCEDMDGCQVDDAWPQETGVPHPNDNLHVESEPPMAEETPAEQPMASVEPEPQPESPPEEKETWSRNEPEESYSSGYEAPEPEKYSSGDEGGYSSGSSDYSSGDSGGGWDSGGGGFDD
jgi:uncharacterized membrane protein YgcG